MLQFAVCSGNQIVTGRSLTQEITPNVVLAQDISIPVTKKKTEAFCPQRKSGGENHVYCLLMWKDGFGTATRATLCPPIYLEIPCITISPRVPHGATAHINNLQSIKKATIDILTRDQGR